MRPSVRTTRARSGHSSCWGDFGNDLAFALLAYAPGRDAGCKRDDPGQICKGEPQMKRQKLVKMASAVVLTLGVIALTGRLSTPLSVQAQEAQDNHQGNHKDDGEASLVRIGFEIAPVPLNLGGKDPWKVGLGSFLVNAVGDCNGCHTGGGPRNFN